MGCLYSINNNHLKQPLLSNSDEFQHGSGHIQSMSSIQKMNIVCEHWKRVLKLQPLIPCLVSTIIEYAHVPWLFDKASPYYEYDHLYKLVLIGDASVGKSNIVSRFIDDTFTNTYMSTIGVDFKIGVRNVKGHTKMLQIWDTAGQQRFKQITRAYYRGARGILLIFDITNTKSFEMITDEYKQIKTASQQMKQKSVVMLIGSKCDLVKDRNVSVCQAQRLANKLGCITYMEVSAKNNINITRCFHMLIETIQDVDRFAFDRNRPWMYPYFE
eukprot:23732_1